MSILNPLYDAVAWLIMRIHAILAVPLGPASGATWALTIVVLVVLMRLLLLPLFVKQMHAQQKMLQLNPQVQELRKRYKSDKQKLNEEMMKLYRENGANPLSGCLPLVAQLPVWFALFSVLRAISLGHDSYGLTKTVVDQANRAHIFGVTIADRFLFSHTHPALHVKVVIIITVLLSAVTTFLTVRQSMKRGMMQSPGLDESNPMAGAQKYMAYIAPLFALSGLYWQYGLVLYWLATNLWTLGQQYFLFKKIPPLNAATATAGTGAAQPGAARPAPARPAASGKGTGATTAKPSAQGKPAAKQPAAARPAPAGKGGNAGLGIPPPASNGGGGVLRKLVRGRAEPEPEPEPPEVKMVRQQRTRQSRSKRTGKR
ncbi:MAG TPA: membrane protein insertase YidC [Streptosporangiaceae bacterium]|nr:membrane protein insertase YidC [Streptosporangiaceae bacterium]